jgi:tripartite-type tricarboxylate transporter receptor subunit TctC
MNMNRRRLLAAACASLAAPIALGVRGDGKPVIRILVGLPPGGGTDAIARVISDRLPIELGQPVIVENKVGVGGRSPRVDDRRARWPDT